MSQRKRILVAPLNWGLGHATRCIPVIRELQKQGVEVLLASDGRALDLLRQEFPELATLPLPGYNIRYRSASMVWNMALQLPNILRSVFHERRQIQKYIAAYGIQGIISDNRYGCRSSRVPGVFLTHQLFIKIPFRPLEKMVQWLNFRLIRGFDECWVPDVEGEPNLSGELGHLILLDRLPPCPPSERGGVRPCYLFSISFLLKKLAVFSSPPLRGAAGGEPAPRKYKYLKYLGALSRLRHFKTEKKYDAIAVLSGPEPQRTLLEKEITEQAKKLPHHFLIVQGKTEKQERFFIKENIEIVSYLASEDLNEAILASGIFIGRSGYSTIMDLAKLGTRALLIPTPGQTEQEYLAEKFFQEGIFNKQQQGKLNLAQAFSETTRFSGFSNDFSDEHLLRQAITGFLSQL